MQATGAINAPNGEVSELIAELPDSYWLIHRDGGVVLWTDGIHYGGTADGGIEMFHVNGIASQYGLGLREAWKHDDTGRLLLSLGHLEGVDFR